MDAHTFRVRLSDVATAAGVSKATASLALNGRPGISRETRARVVAVAEEVGYRPNRAAREIASGVTRTIGAVLSPSGSHPDVPTYYVAELLAGAEQEARAHDHRIQVVSWGGDQDHPPDETGFAGMVYLGGAFPDRMLVRAAIPSVLVGTFFPQWPHDAVVADNSRGAYLAVSHLLQTGRQHVAFVNGPTTTRTSELKMLGYGEAVREVGHDVDSSLIRVGDFSLESGYAATMSLFDRAPSSVRPADALFVANDTMAVGALQALDRLGIEVPGEVSVAGYGDSPTGPLVRPSLTTVRVFQRRMGIVGMRRLVERLHGEVEGAVRILVGPELIVRDSSNVTGRTAHRE